MFTLPSIWNLVVSTTVFIIVVGYTNRFLNARGIHKGTTRGLSVFALAYLLSWGGGELADWAVGTPAAVQPTAEISQLLKTVGQ